MKVPRTASSPFSPYFLHHASWNMEMLVEFLIWQWHWEAHSRESSRYLKEFDSNSFQDQSHTISSGFPASRLVYGRDYKLLFCLKCCCFRYSFFVFVIESLTYPIIPPISFLMLLALHIVSRHILIHSFSNLLHSHSVCTWILPGINLRGGWSGHWNGMNHMKCESLSGIWLFATPWTVACQAPLSMGFSRQEYWSG